MMILKVVAMESMTTILIVDDNPEILNLLRIMLEQRGYKTVRAHNGHEALETLRSLQPDLILSNLFMPLMDGMTFLEAVRSSPDTSTIPFLMMTAAPKPEIRREALDRGASGFIEKPFHFDVLTKTLIRFAGQPRS